MSVYAMAVSERVSYLDGRGCDTPPALLTGGLPGFLDGVAKVLGRGTVIVAADVANRVGLPAGVPLPTGDNARRWTALQDVRKAGWDVRDVHRWSTFTRGARELHIGLREYIDPGYCPFLEPVQEGRRVTGATVSAGLAEWFRLVGVPYRGEPADAVNAVIMATASCYLPGKRRQVTPTWRPRNRPHEDVIEHAYHRTQWERPGHWRDGEWLHGLDAVRSYMAAMSCLEVSPAALVHHAAPTGFDPTLHGWWLAELAPWTDPDLPDPAGYDPEWTPGTPRLVTTPTLVLLAELGELGVHGGFRVLESWTAPASRGIFKPAAKILELAYRNGGPAVRAAVKAGYHAAHGKWRSAASDIRRPDWSAALVALARANLWRKMWKAAAASGNPDGVWLPAFVDGIDTVYYPSRRKNPAAAPVPGFPLVDPDDPATDRLGRFVAKYRLHNPAPDPEDR